MADPGKHSSGSIFQIMLRSFIDEIDLADPGHQMGFAFFALELLDLALQEISPNSYIVSMMGNYGVVELFCSSVNHFDQRQSTPLVLNGTRLYIQPVSLAGYEVDLVSLSHFGLSEQTIAAQIAEINNRIVDILTASQRYRASEDIITPTRSIREAGFDLESALQKVCTFNRQISEKMWDESTLYSAPHKLFLLLAIIDQFEHNASVDPIFTIGPWLRDRYEIYWETFFPNRSHSGIQMPISHMRNSGFLKYFLLEEMTEEFNKRREISSFQMLTRLLRSIEIQVGVLPLFTDDHLRRMLRKRLVEMHCSNEFAERLLKIGQAGAII